MSQLTREDMDSAKRSNHASSIPGACIFTEASIAKRRLTMSHSTLAVKRNNSGFRQE